MKRKENIKSAVSETVRAKNQIVRTHTATKVYVGKNKMENEILEYILAPANFHNSWKFHDKLLFFRAVAAVVVSRRAKISMRNKGTKERRERKNFVRIASL